MTYRNALISRGLLVPGPGVHLDRLNVVAAASRPFLGTDLVGYRLAALERQGLAAPRAVVLPNGCRVEFARAGATPRVER